MEYYCTPYNKVNRPNLGHAGPNLVCFEENGKLWRSEGSHSFTLLIELYSMPCFGSNDKSTTVYHSVQSDPK